MKTLFPTFSERIRTTNGEHDLRALLAEVGRWRASRLVDLGAQREASWAMSEIYRQLGDREHAGHEAQQLLSLCRTPPNASREQLQFAERHAHRLDRNQKPEPASDAWADALSLASTGRWAEARRAAPGRNQGRVASFRLWTQLAEALALPESEQLEAVRRLEQELAARFTPAAPPARAAKEAKPAPDKASKTPGAREPKADKAPPAQRSEGPLAALIGAPVPVRRDPLVKVIQAAIEAEPARTDALAAAALRDHVEQHGLRRVAPWLFGIVVQALATTEGTDTRAAISELSEAFATTAYAEAGFLLATDALRAASVRGHTLGSLRRGVMRGAVPDARRVWTLRIVTGEVERLLAIVGPVQEGWEASRAAEVVARVASLSPSACLWASGPAHQVLRDAAAAAGLPVVDTADAAAVVDALEAVPLDARPAGAPVEVAEAAPTPTSERRRREEAPAAVPDPSDDLRALFEAEPATELAAYAEPLSALKRAYRAFVAIRASLDAMTPEQADPRLATYLRAVHEVAPTEVRLAEGMTDAIRVAAAVPGGAVDSLLSATDDVAERYGGPRIAALVGAVRALVQDGWVINRVLIGLTRREERDQPALGALGRSVTGLLRLVVDRGPVRGELWWVDGPSPEARVAMPLLLVTDHPRLVVSPSGQGTEDWLDTGAAPVIAWTGEEGGQVRDAAAAWSAGSDA